MLTLIILLVWILGIGFVYQFSKLFSRLPVESPLFMLAVSILAYGTLSPLQWILQGGQYSSLIDSRNVSLSPSLEEQIYLTLSILIFLLGFVLGSYPFLRAIARHSIVKPPQLSTSFSIWMGIASLSALFFSTIYSFSYHLNSYGPQPTDHPTGPFLNFANFIVPPSSAIFLIWCMQSLRRRYLQLFAFSGVFLCLSLSNYSRTAILQLFLLSLFAYTAVVSAIPLRRLLLISFFPLLYFLATAIFRHFSIDSLDQVFLLFGEGLGEFSLIWGNAIHISRLSSYGLDIPLAVQLSELTTLLPSSMLWFQKSSFSQWYLNTFYTIHSQNGGGLMFGTLAQITTGNPIFSALWRGLAIGSLTALIESYLRKKLRSWWALPLLMCFSLWSYYVMRDTTFASIANTILASLYFLVFPYLPFCVLKSLLNSSSRI